MMSSLSYEFDSNWKRNVSYLCSCRSSPIFARMIHNYFRWRLMWTYMDDLPYEYVHAHRVFLDAYYGYPLHSTNEEYCTREVIRRFPLAVQRLYTRDMNTDPKNVCQ